MSIKISAVCHAL